MPTIIKQWVPAFAGVKGSGKYSPPGGHLEFGESFEDCAKREVLEEVGIEIDNITFIGITNDIFTNEGKHYIVIAMKAIWSGGDVQLKEPDKCEKWEWMKWNDIPDDSFLPVHNLKKQIKSLTIDN